MTPPTSHEERQELDELQRWMASKLRELRGLPKDEPTTALARRHFTGNDRLSPVEQLEVYRQQFWLRHTSALLEDFPGLSGILGQRDWERLTESYLGAHAPTSFTLRDLGAALPADAALFGVSLVSVLDFVGALFLRALKMLVVPLIAASIIAGIVSVGGTPHLGRLGLKTTAYYAVTSLVAILIGLTLVDLVETGTTLVENGLEERERVADVSSLLVANRAQYKLRHAEVRPLIERLRKAATRG